MLSEEICRQLKIPPIIDGWWLQSVNMGRGLLAAIAPRLKVQDWADQYRELSKVSSVEHGKWSTARTPYLREIMDELSDDSPTHEVVFQKPVQIGGTECGNNWIGEHIFEGTGAMMIVLPTQNGARKSSRTRITPMINDTPCLRDRVRPVKSRDSGNTTLMKQFGGGAGVLIFAGANSASDLKSQPAGKIFLDEIEEYPTDVDGQGDPEELITARATTFASHRKIFKVSTPTIVGGRIDLAYRASDQRLYFVPCPHCQHKQSLIFERLKWQTKKVWERTDKDTGELEQCEPGAEGAVERDTEELEHVWYECEQCGQAINEIHKTDMLTAGEWIAQNPGADRAAGFKLNALYSPLGWYSWRGIVLDYLKAQKDTSGAKKKTFTNQALGEAYDEPGESVDEHWLKRRVEAYRIGDPVPSAALFVTAGVDVQGDRLEVRVWGYGKDAQSWLIDRVIIYGPPAAPDTWVQLERLLENTWPHELGGKVRIDALAVDAGDGNTTHFVRAWVRKWTPSRRVIATKGQAIQGKALLGRATDQDVNWRGKIIKGGVKIHQLGSDTGKGTFYGRLKIEQPAPGFVHLPSGLPDEEFLQLTSEKQITRYLRGHAKKAWHLMSGRRNEALDCRVMADAALEFLNPRASDFEKRDADLRHRDLFTQELARSEENKDADAERLPPGRTDAASPTKAPQRKRPRSNWLNRGTSFN